MEPTSDDAQRRDSIRSALIIGGILGAVFVALVVAALVKGRGVGLAPGDSAKPSAPLLRADQLGSYGGEVVSVRARLKRVTHEERDGRISVRASAGFEDNRTGLLLFCAMDPAEFARWSNRFAEGEWVIVTGTYSKGGDSHDLLDCTIRPDR